MSTQRSYAIVILAAGFSNRLGKPKQLVKIGEHTLLNHSIAIAAATKVEKVFVVLNDQINIDIPENYNIIINKNASDGIGTSIQRAVAHISDLYPTLSGIIIMLCDQPFVSQHILKSLIEMHEISGKPIVASAYAGTYGTPALFHQSYMDKLLLLEGNVGAKKIMQQYPEDLITIDFPKGYIDIDTPEDEENLQKIFNERQGLHSHNSIPRTNFNQ